MVRLFIELWTVLTSCFNSLISFLISFDSLNSLDLLNLFDLLNSLN